MIYLHSHIARTANGCREVQLIGAFDELALAQDALKPTAETMLQYNPDAARLLEWWQVKGAAMWTNAPRLENGRVDDTAPHSVIIGMELNVVIGGT